MNKARASLFNPIRDRALVIDRLPEVEDSSDPADNFLLGMAEAGQADYIVTGDKSGVLAIERHGRTTVATVTRTMKALGLG